MNYTTWLRWGVIASIFLIPFVVFISPAPGMQILGNMYFPYITGKNFMFRLLVELAVLLYVILALKEPKYRPKSSILMWTSVAFLVWMAVATALSVDPVKSFFSNFERMEGYVGLFHMFAWFVVAGAVLTAENLWERFFNTSIGAAMFMGLLALFQVLHLFNLTPSSQSGARADTTLGNATYLAVYMLVHLFITLFMLLRRRTSAGWQVYYGLALVLEAVGLYVTQTRGAILGALGGLLVAAIWIAIAGRGNEWKGLRRLSIGGLVAIVVIVGGFFAVKNTSFVQHSQTLSRFASISLADRTTIARFQIWNMAWHGFLERPVQGWGQENFNYVFNKFYDPAMWDQEQWFDRAHNQFIDWFINGGFPAGILYLGLYALAAWAIWRNQTLSVPEQAILIGLFAGFAFNNLFVFDNLTSALYFWALLAFVHSGTARQVPKRLAFTRPMGEHTLAIWAPIVGVVVLFGGWWLNGPAIVRAQTLVTALNPNTAAGQQTAQGALALFQQALGPEGWPAGNKMGIQEVNEQLMQFATSINSSSQDPNVRTQVNTVTNNAAQAFLAQRTHDARMELFYGTFLTSTGQAQQGIVALQQALADSPKKQQIFFQLGVTQLNSGDTQGALATFKQAYELDHNYDLARILYAAGYYYVGQTAAGDALLTEKFGSAIVDNDQLLHVYMDTKLYSRAEAIWQLRIKSNPKNTDDLLGLAQVYFASGDKADTIATLTKISQIDPTKAAQVEQIITQINNGTLKPGQ